MTTQTPSNQVYTQGNGSTSTDPFITVFSTTSPTTSSVNYTVGKRWVNLTIPREYILANFATTNGVITANWVPLGGSGGTGILTITGNSGGAVGPDGSNNINVVGDGTTINIVGNPGSHTLTSNVILPAANTVLYSETSAIGGVNVQTDGALIIGGPGTPVAATLTAGANITITNAPNSITIAASGGGGALSTLTGNSGGAVGPTGGNIDTVGTGSITVVGNPGASTLTAQLTGLTAHNVLLGEGTATVGLVAPPVAIGIPLVGAGAAADPVFGTALVPGGGTSSTSFDINGAVYSNTTTTGALQAATLAAGQLLIGGTAAPAAAFLTAGTGITIVEANHSITISSSGSAAPLPWTDEAVSFAAVSNHGYFVTATATATLTATPSQGDVIAFLVDATPGPSTLTIQANAGQFIDLGIVSSAAAGIAVNTEYGDSITLVYRAADTSWFATSSVGSWTLT